MNTNAWYEIYNDSILMMSIFGEIEFSRFGSDMYWSTILEVTGSIPA
jgi:hypothetical protein